MEDVAHDINGSCGESTSWCCCFIPLWISAVDMLDEDLFVLILTTFFREFAIKWFKLFEFDEYAGLPQVAMLAIAVACTTDVLKRDDWTLFLLLSSRLLASASTQLRTSSACTSWCFLFPVTFFFLFDLDITKSGRLDLFGLNCSWRRKSGGGGALTKSPCSFPCRWKMLSSFAFLRRWYCNACATFFRASEASTGIQQWFPRFKNRPPQEWIIASTISFDMSYFSSDDITWKYRSTFVVTRTFSFGK